MSDNGFGESDAMRISDIIDGGSRLRFITLDGNHIGADALQMILDADSELEDLSVQDCQLGDDGAIAVSLAEISTTDSLQSVMVWESLNPTCT